MNRRVVKDMLDVAGAIMTEAEDAESGLRLIDSHDYQVILMDLRMPGMDGLTAIGHIRARPDRKARLPVIVVTADTAPDLRERCIEAGADCLAPAPPAPSRGYLGLRGGGDEVIFKPVSLDLLFEAIGRLLARDAEAGGLIA